MSSGGEHPSNCSCLGAESYKIRGMIDANAYHSSRITWPSELTYVQENGRFKSLKEVIEEKFPYYSQGLPTVEMGDELVDINTEMYNQDNGVVSFQDGKIVDEPDKKDIPSLIIATTMDMEFAHINGYNGEVISCKATSDFEIWEKQIEDTEKATASNPLRLFSLYCYDPRRNRLPNDDSPGENICRRWDEPFGGIVGCKDPANEFNKIWLGFYMNPFLGFRPFDEFCEHLPDFYEKCAKEEIPILAHCASGGIVARNAVDVGSTKTYPITTYRIFDKIKIIERLKKSKKRNERLNLPDDQKKLCSDWYRSKNDVGDTGEEFSVDDTDLDHFRANYGHPRNWIPVLKCFPGLRLCLAGFGGNSEWQHESMTKWTHDDKNYGLPPREWIRCIIQLTRDNNVYADISGLNIYDHRVRFALRKMLRLIQNLKNDEDIKNEPDDNNNKFKHLKYKLIFGSGWYFTYLMDMSYSTESFQHNYRDYCREFKILFDEVDPTGEFWERVSLINPWKFYGLSKEKIEKWYETLDANQEVDREMLKKMKNVFYDSKGCELGLIDYVDCRKKNDPDTEPQAPDDNDDDLVAYKTLPHTQSQIYIRFPKYHYEKILEKLEKIGINKELGEDSIEIGNLLRWLWCRYEDKLKVHDTKSTTFKFEPNGVFTNLGDDTRFNEWEKAYQKTFHELFHNIDHLVGIKKVKWSFEGVVYSYSSEYPDFGIIIIKDVIELTTNGLLYNEIEYLDKHTKACLYDIIGGVIDYDLYRDSYQEKYGHGPEEWLFYGTIRYLLHENRRKMNKEILEKYIYENTLNTAGFETLIKEIKNATNNIKKTFVDLANVTSNGHKIEMQLNSTILQMGVLARDYGNAFRSIKNVCTKIAADAARTVTNKFTSKNLDIVDSFYRKDKEYNNNNIPRETMIIIKDICTYHFPQRLASETFANMASVALVNPPAFNAMKMFLPKSYNVFIKILRSMYEKT
jgi:hypothetical protein